MERTTLAEVANAADVPVGNVYYYFKTKDDLVQAVIAAHADEIEATLAALEQAPDAEGAAEGIRADADRSARASSPRYGCPQGSLCSELDKRDDELEPLAAGS